MCVGVEGLSVGKVSSACSMWRMHSLWRLLSAIWAGVRGSVLIVGLAEDLLLLFLVVVVGPYGAKGAA